MSERSSIFQVGRSMGRSDLPDSHHPSQPEGAAQEWERILWSKTAPALQQPIEEARPFGRSDHTPTPIKWIRLFWVRRWSKRKAEGIRHDIHETGNNMAAFMTMAQYAINLAVQSEPRSGAQIAKRRLLMDRWRNTYAQVFSRNAPL